MSIAYIRPLVQHFNQIKFNIGESYSEINIKDLPKDDKLYLFHQVLPIVGSRVYFIKNEFFNIIKSVDKDFEPLEIWEKYSVVTIQELTGYVEDEDELFNDSVKDEIIDKLIDLALEKRIYSFKQDW